MFIFCFSWLDSLYGSGPPHRWGFKSHCDTPLSVGDLYLTTHTHKKLVFQPIYKPQFFFWHASLITTLVNLLATLGNYQYSLQDSDFSWYSTFLSMDIAVGIMSGPQVGRYRYRLSISCGGKRFFFSEASQQSLGPTLSPVQSGQGMTLITHLRQAPRLRMCGAVPLPYAVMTWTGINVPLPICLI